MLEIDLSGRRAFVAGVADEAGFGFAIAKKLAEAGASVCIGTWPPAYGILTRLLESGRMRDALQLAGGGELAFERIYALDVAYDELDDVPPEVRESRRYKPHADFSIQGVADRILADFGEKPLDVIVHSIANAPEVRRSLLETSRKGYLSALSVSAYSLVSMAQRMAPLLRPGGSLLSLSFMASRRVIPGYGGGMSAAKAALESDTRTLAFELGRSLGVRVNCISAGPWASRAASAVGHIDSMIEHARRHAPLPEALQAREVAAAAAFLASPLASGITGTTLHVDKGLHVMGTAVTEPRSDPDDPPTQETR